MQVSSHLTHDHLVSETSILNQTIFGTLPHQALQACKFHSSRSMEPVIRQLKKENTAVNSAEHISQQGTCRSFSHFIFHHHEPLARARYVDCESMATCCAAGIAVHPVSLQVCASERSSIATCSYAARTDVAVVPVCLPVTLGPEGLDTFISTASFDMPLSELFSQTIFNDGVQMTLAV